MGCSRWTFAKLMLFIGMVCILTSSATYANTYRVSGAFLGNNGGEVYGTLVANDSFTSSSIETAWQNYLSTEARYNFFLELEYPITSFDLYRVDTHEDFFSGKQGFIEVIVTGSQRDSSPNATWYSAWELQGLGVVHSAYSGRDGDDVIFSENNVNLTDFEYDQLAQTISLSSGTYNDEIYTTVVNLTLNEVTPVPEPSTLLLLGLGILLLKTRVKSRK